MEDESRRKKIHVRLKVGLPRLRDCLWSDSAGEHSLIQSERECAILLSANRQSITK